MLGWGGSCVQVRHSLILILHSIRIDMTRVRCLLRFLRGCGAPRIDLINLLILTLFLQLLDLIIRLECVDSRRDGRRNVDWGDNDALMLSEFALENVHEALIAAR